MLSLHFTGNLWFLLLLVPGFFILWKQYRPGLIPVGPSTRRFLLLGLQSLALLLLTLWLLAPEVRRHRIEFHNPSVLILRDQSSSFQNGGYLGLGSRYAHFEKIIRDKYSSQEFGIHSADFSDRTPAVRDTKVQLTNLASAFDYVDSTDLPNLQAIFLFSDGRSNLDSGRQVSSFQTPVFPVIFPTDSLHEVQMEKVSLEPVQGGREFEVKISYQSFSPKALAPSFYLIQNGKDLLHRDIPNLSTHNSWQFLALMQKGGMAAGAGVGGHIRAVLIPNPRSLNINPFNDSLDVDASALGEKQKIYLLRPVRSLDEKGMLDILARSETDRVEFLDQAEFSKRVLSERDQVWMEAGVLTGSARWTADLKKTKAKLVVYYRSGSEARGRTQFSPQAVVKPSRIAAEVFPDGIVRIGDLTPVGMEAQERNAEIKPLVEISEGTKGGVLIGRGILTGEKQALFFSLPQIWEPLFDPQADYTVRTHIMAFIQAIKFLADGNEEDIRVQLPQKIYDRVPFDLSIRLPEITRAAKAGGDLSANPLKLSISTLGFQETVLPSAKENSHPPEWAGLSLAQGRYFFVLFQGEKQLWKDSVTVGSKAELEWAKIGFDEMALAELASFSGGRLLTPARLTGSNLDSIQVSSMLPVLPSAQIRKEETEAIPLYNTTAFFLLIFSLLSISWFLRKKWSLD